FNTLTAQEQQHLANVNNLEQQRVSFNEGVERQLFDIRISALSAFDQYVAKAKEAERLISEARVAGAQGDIAQATKYTNEAIALANQLGKVVNSNGDTVVSALEAQQKKISLLKEAQAGLNTDIAAQKDLEQKAADALGDRIKAASGPLQTLQKEYDG